MFLKQSILYIVSSVFVLVPTVSVFAVTQYEIATYSAANICQNGATLNGYVNPFFTTDTIRWFEWGTSQDYLPNKTSSTRNGSNTEYFKQDIHRLESQTTYYFRAAAQNSKGLAYGDVFSFKTEGGVPCVIDTNTTTNTTANTTINITTNTTPPANTSISQSTITKPATDITNASARLNASALSSGTSQTYGWFEWGATPDLGQTTIKKPLGTEALVSWNEMVSGLVPGTAYFFKSIAENRNGRFEGTLFSFRTDGTAPTVSSVSNTSNQAASVIQPLLPKQKPTITTSLKDKKTIEVAVIPSINTATPKERVSETIQFENTTDTTLKEVMLRVILPCEVEYVPATGDTFLQTGKMLTYRIGDVKPKEKIKFSLWTKVGEDALDKAEMETIAVVNWEDKTSSGYTQSVGRAVVTVDKNKAVKKSTAVAVEANKDISSSASSFFPTTLKDWGAVIGFLFLLFAGYIVFLITRRKGEEANSFDETSAVYPVPNETNTPQIEHDKDPFVTNKKTPRNETIVSAVPLKKTITEKGIPPDNLPV